MNGLGRFIQWLVLEQTGVEVEITYYDDLRSYELTWPNTEGPGFRYTFVNERDFERSMVRALDHVRTNVDLIKAT